MKERVSQEKGLARIQELMEMFPEMPRQQVVAADYIREGLRHTAVLDEIGRWALPDAHDHYDYNIDEQSPEDLVRGVSLTPKKIYFGNRREHWLILDSRSPYEVRYEGGGRYWLYRDGEPIEEVYFAPCPQWFWKTTSRGRPMNLVLNANVERRFGVYVTDYCEYFKDGNQCLFCNLNPTGDHFAKLGRPREPVKWEQDVYEAFLAFAQETVVEGISLIGGGFYNRSKEADLHLRFLEVLKRAMRESGCQVEKIRLCPQAIEEADSLRFKEAGTTAVQHNMEVWDPKLFQIICPGKAKNVGRERWIESLLKAVEIFGWGNANTAFVLGVEMIPPFGFKTEDEASESVLEGFRFLASHGVTIDIIPFQPRPRIALAQGPRPRSEYVLRMELERDRLHKEYNLVDHFKSVGSPGAGPKGPRGGYG